MNFSKTCKLSRLLSLLVALLMLATLFAGCKKEDDSTNDTSEPNLNLDLSDETIPSETQTQPTETEPVIINEKLATVTQQLNIRSAPSTEGSTIVGTLYAGDKVEVERRETLLGVEWAYISEPEDGWITMEYVTMDYVSNEPAGNDTSTPAGNGTPAETKPAEDSANAQSVKGVITASELNIRSEASTDSDVQGSYKKGDVITILEAKNGWGRTNKGWIKMDYVNTSGAANNNTANNTTNNNDNDDTATADGTTYFVTASQLNIRDEASTEGSTVVGKYAAGDEITILETKNGWGRTNKGWVSMNYIYKTGANNGSNPCDGIVTSDNLNVRSGPGTGYDAVGSFDSGERVNILERITIGGTTWGCTSNGWISMDHVYVDGTDIGKSGLGTITGDNLNIRSGPGTGYGSVGSLDSGKEVTILFQLEVGDTIWGCIEEGWISLDYVDLG